MEILGFGMWKPKLQVGLVDGSGYFLYQLNLPWTHERYCGLTQ